MMWWSLIIICNFATSFQPRRQLRLATSLSSIRISDNNDPPIRKNEFHPYNSHQTSLFLEQSTRENPHNGKHSLAWNAKYQELVEFYKKHGHLRVGVEQNGILHRWIYTQRRKRKGDKGHVPLTNDQISLLDEVDFVWNPKKGPGLQDLRWVTKYQELVEFYKKHGHMRVERHGSLYQWMALQRRKYKVSSEWHAPLTDNQIQLLDELDFDWNPKQGRPKGSKGLNDKRWIAKYQELADFYKKYGHLRVEPGCSLYTWMSSQRRKRKGDKGHAPLTDDQIELLDDISFPWTPRRKSGGLKERI